MLASKAMSLIKWDSMANPEIQVRASFFPCEKRGCWCKLDKGHNKSDKCTSYPPSLLWYLPISTEKHSVVIAPKFSTLSESHVYEGRKERWRWETLNVKGKDQEQSQLLKCYLGTSCALFPPFETINALEHAQIVKGINLFPRVSHIFWYASRQ